MSETNDNVTSLDSGRKLADAVRAAKNAAADRDDVVVDMRDAERMRLEILANELASVIAEVPHELDIFDFAISSGLQPRFWVDGVSHVAMGRDKRNYRFVKDTRNGRIVLADTADLRAASDAVTRYIAERMVERERMLEGGAPVAYRSTERVSEPEAAQTIASTRQAAASPNVAQSTPKDTAVEATEVAPAAKSSGWKAVLWALAIFLLGGAFGFSIMATQWWQDISRSVTG